jgi:DNA-binding transcriptional LysR family regulator
MVETGETGLRDRTRGQPGRGRPDDAVAVFYIVTTRRPSSTSYTTSMDSTVHRGATGWTGRLLSDAAFAGERVPRRVVCEMRDWELFLELVSAGVGIGFAPVGLQYPVLTAPDSVLRLIAVDGVRLERHIYVLLPVGGRD